MRIHWKKSVVACVSCVMMVCVLSGCAAAQEFRSAAGASIESGVRSITTGLLDGFFAVFDPDGT